MRIPVDRQSKQPLYVQIEDYLRSSILSGNLAPDTRLPASRELARDLGISRITVENAYAELEADGLVVSRVGSGTYVLPPYSLPAVSHATGPWPLWQQNLHLHSWEDTVAKTDAMLVAAAHPRPLSFADGNGDPRLFPVDDFRKAMQEVLRNDGIAALEYGEPGGFPPLRNAIAHILASQGIQTAAEDVLITSGSQQAMSLVLQLLVQPGDTILVESPTYAVALDLFHAHGLRVVDIPVDKDGMQVEELEGLLQRYHPKLIYTIPNFQNPTGACMNGRRRRLLVSLADRYNVPILEDDFVGDLRYEGSAQPALKALDPGGRVIYISSFSKMFLPGLRVGFMVAEGPICRTLVSRKHVHDLATSNLIQHALNAYVTVGRYQTHLRRSCQLYRRRREAMLEAIRRYVPLAHVNPPMGGLFMWLRLPENVSSYDLLQLSAKEGVAFAPGSRYFTDPKAGTSYLRLNFAMLRPDEIEEGIKRLGRAVDQYLDR